MGGRNKSILKREKEIFNHLVKKISPFQRGITKYPSDRFRLEMQPRLFGTAEPDHVPDGIRERDHNNEKARDGETSPLVKPYL